MMLPMANTTPRTDKQVFCYVSLMKLLTNREPHTATPPRQSICYLHTKGSAMDREQGQAQAERRTEGAVPRTGSCSAGS